MIPHTKYCMFQEDEQFKDCLKQGQPDVTNTAPFCFSLQRVLTSEHFPELHPPIHASRGQEPGTRTELHGIDLPIVSVLQDKCPVSNPTPVIPKKKGPNTDGHSGPLTKG